MTLRTHLATILRALSRPRGVRTVRVRPIRCDVCKEIH